MGMMSKTVQLFRIAFVASAITLACGIPATDMDTMADQDTAAEGETSRHIVERTLIPRDQPCVPAFVAFYFLCADMWCEPQICFQVPIFNTWITSYDYMGTCGPRPAQGEACVDKALIKPLPPPFGK